MTDDRYLSPWINELSDEQIDAETRHLSTAEKLASRTLGYTPNAWAAMCLAQVNRERFTSEQRKK